MTMTVSSNGCDPRITGLPGIAVRAGRALESWGRRAASTSDPDETRENHRRRYEARMALDERDRALSLQRYQFLR